MKIKLAKKTTLRRAFYVVLIAILLIPLIGNNPAQAKDDTAIPQYAWTYPSGTPFSGGHTKDTYQVFDDGPIQGAPLGGMGAGAIGRTYNGDFAIWNTTIGQHLYESRLANMFSVYTKPADGAASTQALYAGAPNDNTLNAWKWNYPQGGMNYWSLYPRSGYTYDGLPIKLSVEQFSPVIPGDYKASSYPVATFTYTATNPGTQPVTVGLMFTWENMLGANKAGWRAGNMHSMIMNDGDLVGVKLERKDPFSGNEWDGSMAIAAQKMPGVTLGTCAQWNPEADGSDIWSDFKAHGGLTDKRQGYLTQPRETLGTGVSATFTLQPGQTMQVPFFLSWDQPVMTFGKNRAGDSWYKRYTAFFPPDGAQAWPLVEEAAQQRDTWQKAILDWQTPILTDKNLPDWYKTDLFNELYYMVDAGTAWDNGKVGGPKPAADYMGGFLMLECFDYPFYSTFDVDFYASFALMQLWPDLEKDVITEFAATVSQADNTPFRTGSSQADAVRKVADAVPHDLGGPDDSPWLKPNWYTWQDVNRWKDLNAKFVLRLYRDAVLLNDPKLAVDHFPEVKLAMSYLASLDKNGVGIPENEGIPDQTYDTWPAKGVSAYSGGLWLAALKASAEIAKLAGDSNSQKNYEAMLTKAQDLYEKSLWDDQGGYYTYDASNSPSHDDVMADQLAGQWYLDFLNLSVLPDDHVMKALNTIYAKNVAGFGGGQMGAVNGTHPDGSIDTSGLQSQEVWTGVTYSVASMMLKRGLTDDAWKTAFGVYNVVWQKSGYWFRTPEAYDVTGNFRAQMYMRPLAVWAIELAYKQTQK